MSESIPVSEVRLDEDKWPKSRRVESSICRAREYWGQLVLEMYKKYGMEGTKSNNDQMMEMARKYVPRALKNFNIQGNDARTAASYFKLVDKIVFDVDFEIIEDTPRRVRMRGTTGCPLSANPQEELTAEICLGGMGHETVACQIINPELKFSAPHLMSDGDLYCDMCFELPDSAPLSEVSVPVSLVKLDEAEWPEARRIKARQRRVWEDYGVMVKAIYRNHGMDGMEVVYHVLSASANKYVFIALKNYELKGNDARTAGGYYKIYHKIIFGNELEIIEDTPKKVVMRNSEFCPLSANPQEDLTAELCVNAMGYEHRACEIINPELRFSVPSLRSAGQPYCEYVFEL